jgi:hypothetical protein
MARSRKSALKVLNGRIAEIERHLGRIAGDPFHSSVDKWRSEVRNWIREMEEVLPHVGKKTSVQWQARIDGYRAALGD